MKCVLLKNQGFKCPYLKGKTARHENVLVKELAEEELETLLKLGFRHFGEYFFRPMCHQCHSCIPIRIPVEKFIPSKSVKRLFSRNKHFTVKLEIRYKASVTDGEIIVEAKVTRRKQRLFLGEVVVKNGDGQVVATATGTFMITDSDAKPR